MSLRKRSVSSSERTAGSIQPLTASSNHQPPVGIQDSPHEDRSESMDLARVPTSASDLVGCLRRSIDGLASTRFNESIFQLLTIIVFAITTGVVTTLLSLVIACAQELDNRTDGAACIEQSETLASVSNDEFHDGRSSECGDVAARVAAMRMDSSIPCPSAGVSRFHARSKAVP